MVKWIFPKLHFELERWKWNQEHEIWVSNLGNFKNAQKKNIRCGAQNGYLRIMSPKLQKKVSAHRLIMMTWRPIDNADEMTVDHLDHNKRNNKITNLEWVSLEENRLRAKSDLEAISKPKAQKIKFVPTNYTLEHFYLCCNGLYFTEFQDVFNYMRTQNSCVSNDHYHSIQKVFQTLINSYNNKNPEAVAKGFKKITHNCELSIVKKGA